MKDDKEVLVEIKNEYQELTDKLTRLEAAMMEEEFFSFEFNMKRAFEAQRKAMIEYREALFARIKALNRRLYDGPFEATEANQGFLL